MPLPELRAYYREKRKREFAENRPMGSQIAFRKRIKPLLRGLLSANFKFLNIELVKLREPCVKDDGPYIYACTHNYRLDIEVCLNAIRKSCWLFMGDPNDLYRNFDGFFLWLNGAIMVDTDFREDCRIGKETAIRLLRQGGSLLIYPEGAWNLSENLPVQKLYEGTAEMALRTGAKIIPMAVEQYGKKYVVNTGKLLDPKKYVSRRKLSESTLLKEGKRNLTADLRDALAALRWEIWEKKPVAQRKKLPEDASERLHREISAQYEYGYSDEVIERSRFHDRDEDAMKEAMKSLDRLIPSSENAFLLREAYRRLAYGKKTM